MKRSLLSLSLLLAVLEIAHGVWDSDSVFLPSPSAVALYLGQLAQDRAFWGDVFATVSRLLWGSVLAVPAAVSAAVLIHRSKTVSFLFEPFLYATYPLPKVALFPLLLVFFGIGELSKVAMVFLGVFYILTLSTLAGFRRLESMGFEELARIYRMPRWRELTQVTLLGALPEILTGLKLGVGYGLVMTVVAEFSLSNTGIGVRLWNSWDRFLVIEIYACLVALGALGLATSLTFEALHRLVSRHHVKI